MELQDFAGKTFTLSGWAEGVQDNCSTVSICLNKKWYTFTEDPDDGYRSMLGSVEITPKPSNAVELPKIRVTAQSDGDIVTFLEKGNVVMTFGTDDVDDYYPSCIMHVDIARMSFNNNKAR